MPNIPVSVEFVGYALAALAFIAFIFFVSRSELSGRSLTAASLVSVLWAGTMAVAAAPDGLPVYAHLLGEFALGGAWLFYLSMLLSGAAGAGKSWLVRYGWLVLTTMLLLIGSAQAALQHHEALLGNVGRTLVFGSVLIALYGLVLTEQVYRNARTSQRAGLKFLCLGLGSVFAYNLFLYSDAVLEGQVSYAFWAARGYVVAAACVPLLLVFVQRTPATISGIFVSRHIVFYTATLFGAGVYLVIVGFVGYYVRQFGGDIGPALQVVFLTLALVSLAAVLVSDRVRSHTRVFISKHFYKNRYDYRQEWLRLIGTLTAGDDSIPLPKRALKALTAIVASPAALLFARHPEDSGLVCVACWNTARQDIKLAADSSLVQFLEQTAWVIDVNEYMQDSSRYAGLRLTTEELGLAEASYVVPLMHDSRLLGVAVLAAPRMPLKLNYEDHDLLKTAGQQIASFLAQDMATEQLAEARQFEVFNRLTAYLMHDLKNVIAQQSLVVENAQKHKSNPEFVDDAIATVRSSVARMKRVMEHIQRRPVEPKFDRVELGKLIIRAVSQCADRRPEPSAKIGEQRIWARADPDRLQMALYHAIRNAQDATSADGEVVVALEPGDGHCIIRIADTGRGMDEEFVRERLFKPFDSTKGAQGMGIGAYQLRETVQAIGGQLRIESQPGVGTTVTIELKVA